MYNTHHIITGWSPVPGCHYTHPSDGVHWHLWQGIREFPDFRHLTTVLIRTQINEIRIPTDWQETITPMKSLAVAKHNCLCSTHIRICAGNSTVVRGMFKIKTRLNWQVSM